MNILGFNCFGHDSAASLLVDGKVVYAVEEERLNRKKHFGGFPERAIRQCLDFAKLKVSDLDHVAFYWKPSVSYSKVPVFLLRYLDKVPRLIRESRSWSMEENLGMLHYLSRMSGLPAEIRALDPSGRARFRFHFVEHHLCHAASAFFCSPFDEAAILTVDGAGEWTTAMLAEGRGNKIRKLAEVSTPHSLGAFYQAVSIYLGFKLITGPGKLMGLSSYGRRDSEAYRKLKKLVRLTPDGGFRLDMSYFSYHYTRKSGVSEKFMREFGPPCDTPGAWSEEQLDIAAAVQRVVEDVITHMANSLHRRTGHRDLCIAGGVGLNSVANGRLLDDTPFKRFFIQPAAGDSGTSLGAALYLYNGLLRKPRTWQMNDAFLGPGYDAGAIKAEVERSGLPFVTRSDVSRLAARLLKNGKILGWFQDRLEFGPRALGNRSILTTPCLKDMKDVLNSRVKFREAFRPFAPIVLEEHCGEYFAHEHPSPYMLLVYAVREEKRDAIPAVTHVDGSARVQTVTRAENPRMWELLKAFKEETGVPMLLNTSFNIKGEPIVATPAEAVDSFRRADIDYLVIGDYLLAKNAGDLP